LGYALAPILLASIISTLVHNLFVRIPVSLACWAWSVWGESAAPTFLHTLFSVIFATWALISHVLIAIASMNFFKGTRLPESRTFLAVYPMCLFFFVLAWMIMIQ
jgi:hypothetical protein